MTPLLNYLLKKFKLIFGTYSVMSVIILQSSQ